MTKGPKRVRQPVKNINDQLNYIRFLFTTITKSHLQTVLSLEKKRYTNPKYSYWSSVTFIETVLWLQTHNRPEWPSQHSGPVVVWVRLSLCSLDFCFERKHNKSSFVCRDRETACEDRTSPPASGWNWSEPRIHPDHCRSESFALSQPSTTNRTIARNEAAGGHDCFCSARVPKAATAWTFSRESCQFRPADSYTTSEANLQLH